MSSIATQIFKPSSMADISRLLSHPTIFTSKTPYPILSIPAKPTKLQHLSYSHSTLFAPSLSLKVNNPSSSIITSVGQNPETQLLLEEEDDFVLDNLESDHLGAPILDWKGEGDSEGEEIMASLGGIGEGGVGGFVAEGEKDGGFFPKLSEDAKIYVGNLPYDTDSEGLAALFDQAGTVEKSEVIFDKMNNRSRGFGFVTMSTVEEAEKAVEKFHDYTMNGRPLIVNKAAPRGSRVERPPRAYEPAFRIYVGNLPWDVDKLQLEQIFSEHGKVVEARLVSDRESGRSRGFGFVTMSSETEMNDAIAALDGKDLNGRAIRLKVAEERPRRSFV